MPSQEHEDFYQDIISGKSEQRRIQDKSREYYSENVSKMNEGQADVFEAITQRIERDEGVVSVSWRHQAVQGRPFSSTS